jgi:hypothetical protein
MELDAPQREGRRSASSRWARKRLLGWINLLGGSAVLASYAYGLSANPEMRSALWGGVPEAIRPLYTVSMFTAAAGYFLFTGFLFFRVDPRSARVAYRFGYGIFNLLYLLVLVPSALWLPLTASMIDQPSVGLWIAIRGVLTVVGLGSVGLIVALLRLSPHPTGVSYHLAVAGSIAFTFQTALLDALVWPIFF